MSLGSGPPRRPVSRPSIAANSSSVSLKSNTSMFSAIRSGRVDFGIAERPCWRCQRNITCAGVFPCDCPIWPITGFASGVALLLDDAEPSTLRAGIYAVLTNDERRVEMSNAGHRRAAAYDWSKLTQQHLEIMLSAMITQTPARASASFLSTP